MHQVVGSTGQTLVAAPERKSWREHALAFAAGASILLASLANFLLHNNYPLLRPEVAIVAGVLLLVAALMAVLYVGQRQWGRSLLDGLLVLLFANINGVLLTTAILAGLVVGLFTYWRKISLSGPLAIFGAAVLVTKIAGVGGNEPWLRTETHEVPRPPGVATPKFAILHLLLDEQAGVHGIYPSPEGLRFREELKDFFLQRRFTLYGRAYSEHVHTVNAVPAVLNFGTRFADTATRDWVKVGKTVYFDRLSREGFKIHVLQNDFADLCSHNPISACTIYDSSSLRPTLEAPLTTVERAQLIGLKFVALSTAVAHVSRTFNRAGDLTELYWGRRWPAFEPGNTSRTSTVGAVEALKPWSEQVRQARAGDVYFAHLLLPHYPHVLRSDCSFPPWKDWELRRSRTLIEKRRHTYVEQDRCTLRKIDQVIRAFEQSPGGRDGVVIIHGDHGSRIMMVAPVTDFVGQYSDDDLIAAHATLFAVRGPRTESRYDETPQAITALLRSFAESDFQVDPKPTKPTRRFIQSNRFWEVQHWSELPANW